MRIEEVREESWRESQGWHVKEAQIFVLCCGGCGYGDFQRVLSRPDVMDLQLAVNFRSVQYLGR